MSCPLDFGKFTLDATSPSRPIAEAVALLPAYEFMAGSPGFIKVMIDSLDSASKTPWMASFLNLASWIFSNASTSSSARTHAYANLVLEMLLLVVENEYAASVLCSRSCRGIQLCQKVSPASLHFATASDVETSACHGFRLRALAPLDQPYPRFWIVATSGYATTYTSDYPLIPTRNAYGYATGSYGTFTREEYDWVCPISTILTVELRNLSQTIIGKNCGYLLWDFSRSWGLN